MKNNKHAVRISFAAQPKPVPVAGFIFSNKNGAKIVSRIYNYRKPRLIKSANGWYIEYYYRIPIDVVPVFGNKVWKRFREKHDINKRKGEERQEYATWLLVQIENYLKNGYNPFNPATDYIKSSEIKEIEELSVKDALLLFLETWKKRGIEPASYSKYEKVINRLIEWLTLKRIPYIDVKNITQDHIEKFLNDTKEERKFGNREYNNHFDFTRTAFNFLLSKKYIPESPCAGISKQKTKSTKHRFYDDKSLKDITRALKEIDPYTYLAFQTVYYLCVRSDKELMNLKVGNINWERSVILAEVSKTDQRYIPMDENIKMLLKDYLKDTPNDYFIFGAFGKPSDKKFGAGFFAKRFRKVRDAIGISDSFTVYGAKHTRVIHLKADGVPDAEIMRLTGHKSFEAYSLYLRDLDMTFDMDKINVKSRKV